MEEADSFIRDLKQALEKIGVFSPYNFANFSRRFFELPIPTTNFPPSFQPRGSENQTLFINGFWLLYSPPLPASPRTSYNLDIAARISPQKIARVEAYSSINDYTLIDLLAYTFPQQMNSHRWATLTKAIYSRESITQLLLEYLFSTSVPRPGDMVLGGQQPQPRPGDMVLGGHEKERSFPPKA